MTVEDKCDVVGTLEQATAPIMANEQTRAIISGSLRTLAEFVPVVGGAAAQAWSEFESIQRNARIEDFFHQVNKRLAILEGDSANIKERIEQMPDFARLLEDTVDAVRRETNDHKRHVYPDFFLNLVLQSTEIQPEEREFLLETLDSLTEHDLTVLRHFNETGYCRGDILSNTVEGEFGSDRSKSHFNTKYEQLLEPFMISTAKLEARGIIVPMPDGSEFQSIGGGNKWYNVYRERFWKLMPIGRDLLRIISPK